MRATQAASPTRQKMRATQAASPTSSSLAVRRRIGGVLGVEKERRRGRSHAMQRFQWYKFYMKNITLVIRYTSLLPGRCLVIFTTRSLVIISVRRSRSSSRSRPYLHSKGPRKAPKSTHTRSADSTWRLDAHSGRTWPLYSPRSVRRRRRIMLTVLHPNAEIPILRLLLSNFACEFVIQRQISNVDVTATCRDTPWAENHRERLPEIGQRTADVFRHRERALPDLTGAPLGRAAAPGLHGATAPTSHRPSNSRRSVGRRLSCSSSGTHV